jgi:hypothetical protein
MLVLLNSVLDSKMVVKFTGFNTNDLGKCSIYILHNIRPFFTTHKQAVINMHMIW